MSVDKNTFPIGFEVGTGERVYGSFSHLAIFGLTQESGKTTTLEAFISRIPERFKVLVFRTKKGDLGFEDAAEIGPYFRQRTDWQFVEGLISAHLLEKAKMYRGDIMRAVRGTHSLDEVHKNIKEFLEKSREGSWPQKIYTELDQYLSEIIPAFRTVAFAPDLDLVDKINVMDLEPLSPSLQQLIISSSVDKVMKDREDTIIVLPEGRDFVPGDRKTPAKLSIEDLVRKGAALRNYLWIDSQSLTGLDLDIMRHVGTWFFGKQGLDREVERISKSIPGSTVGPDQIRSLGKGQFVMVHSDQVRLVYIQPAWLDEEQSRRIALGAPLIPRPRSQKPVNRHIKRPEQKPVSVNKAEEIIEEKEEEMDKEMMERISALERKFSEELKQKDEEIRQLKSEKSKEAEPAKPEPAPLEVRTEVEAYEIVIRKKDSTVRKFSTSGLQGRILYILAKTNGHALTRDAVIHSAQDKGWKMDPQNTGRQMAALAGLGFLIKEGERKFVAFRMPKGIRVTVEGE